MNDLWSLPIDTAMFGPMSGGVDLLSTPAPAEPDNHYTPSESSQFGSDQEIDVVGDAPAPTKKRARPVASAAASAKQAAVSPSDSMKTLLNMLPSKDEESDSADEAVNKPKRKRRRVRKSKDDPSYIKERQRHIQIERKRRLQMNESITRLRELVPECNTKDYKCDVLVKAVTYIEEIQALLQKTAMEMNAAPVATEEEEEEKEEEVAVENDATAAVDDGDSSSEYAPSDVSSPRSITALELLQFNNAMAGRGADLGLVL